MRSVGDMEGASSTKTGDEKVGLLFNAKPYPREGKIVLFDACRRRLKCNVGLRKARGGEQQSWRKYHVLCGQSGACRIDTEAHGRYENARLACLENLGE